MRKILIFLAHAVGMVAFPIFWLLDKLGLVTSASVPNDFLALLGLFHKCGLWPVINMRPEEINNIEALALYSFGVSTNETRVVTVARCASEELADVVESEMTGAPQYSNVQKQGRYVMACTFLPPDESLEEKFAAAFREFGVEV